MQACTLGAFPSLFAEAAAGSGIDQLGTCLVLTGLRCTWSCAATGCSEARKIGTL